MAVNSAAAPRTRVTPPAAAAPLPRDTNLMPVYEFVGRAFLRSPVAIGLALALGAIQALVYIYIMPAMPVQQAQYVFVGYTAAALTVIGLVAVRRATRPVYVIRRDHTGRTVLDAQAWWQRDEQAWPDAWRQDIEGRRVLFIDAQQPVLHPFNPWLAPMIKPPSSELAQEIGFYMPSAARLGVAPAKGAAARRLLDTSSGSERMIKNVLLVIAVIATVIGTVIGGYQAQNTVSGEKQQELVEQARLEILEQLRQQGLLPAAPAPLERQPTDFNAR